MKILRNDKRRVGYLKLTPWELIVAGICLAIGFHVYSLFWQGSLLLLDLLLGPVNFF